MRKLVVVCLVASLGIIGLQSAAAANRTAAPHTTTGSNSSVAGNWSVLFTFHDSQHQQEGNGAGTLIFDGAGQLRGTISEQSRCLDTSPTTPCGSATNIQMQVVPPSNYVVKADGYASLDICVNITYGVGPQGGSPGNANQFVEFMWEGSFSKWFYHGRFFQTIYKPLPPTKLNCDPNFIWVQSPNVTTVDLERV